MGPATVGAAMTRAIVPVGPSTGIEPDAGSVRIAVSAR